MKTLVDILKGIGAALLLFPIFPVAIILALIAVVIDRTWHPDHQKEA
jgi:hypothetical protein